MAQSLANAAIIDERLTISSTWQIALSCLNENTKEHKMLQRINYTKLNHITKE